MSDSMDFAALGIRDVIAGWLLCLAVAGLGLICLELAAVPEATRVEARPPAPVTAGKFLSVGVNKPPVGVVSIAVRQC